MRATARIYPFSPAGASAWMHSGPASSGAASPGAGSGAAGGLRGWGLVSAKAVDDDRGDVRRRPAALRWGTRADGVYLHLEGPGGRRAPCRSSRRTGGSTRGGGAAAVRVL